MKTRYNVAACLFVLLMFLSSCGEDRTYEYLELTQENQWIYEKMQDVYLWGDSMKRPDRKSFFAKESFWFPKMF